VILAVVAIGMIWWLRGRGDHGGAKPSAAQTSASVSRNAKPRVPAKPATVSGKVTRKADGSPVAGAVVSLAWAEIGADFSGPKRPTIVATTDDKGAWVAKEVPPGDYMTAATGKGLLPSSRDKVAIASGEDRTGIDFVLEAGGQPVRGTVSDVLGGPIASARVIAKRDNWSLDNDVEFVTLTGADGTYELTLLDGDYRMAATHDDYTKDTDSVEVEGKPVTHDFKLIPGGMVRGQVVARDTGKPVPGAIVVGEPTHRSFSDQHASAIADANGQFLIRGLRSGAIQIQASARGYASGQPTNVQVGIGEEVEGVVVYVDGAFSITGRVVKKGTKDGVAGARVGVFSMSQGSQAEAPDPTDADGAFEVIGVRPGTYMMFAAAQGWMLELGKNVEVVDKDVTGVIVELGAGVTLSGRVEPGAVATVSLELEAEVGITNMFEAVKAAMCRGQSDATGAFTLKNAPPGKFKLQATTKEGTKGFIPITVAGVDQSGLVVPIKPHASIAGRVVDSSGKPVPGMEVSAHADDEKPQMFSINGFSQGVTSAADGTFKLVGLDAGKYEVRAHDRFDFSAFMPGKDKDKKRVMVELAEGQQKTGVTLTVEAHDGVIRGVVMGADHKPAADAWVTARREREPIKGMSEDMDERFGWWNETEPVLTNTEGRFTIDKLKTGKYTVTAEGPRGSSRGETKGVNTGDSTTIQLASLGTLVVTVTQANKPVTKYDVSCDGPVGDIARHAEAADGTFTLDHLAPGDYKCKVRADAGTAEGKVAVPAGEAKLAFAIAAWGSLTGVVVSMFDGKPLPGLLVIAGGWEDSAAMAEVFTGGGIKTDANGKFVVEKVAAGKGNLMLAPPSGPMTSMEMRPFEAKAGQRVDLGTIKIVPPRTGDAGTFGITTEPELTSVPDGGMPTGSKLTVTAVKEGGPAALAGIVEGDKITALNGQLVKDLGPMTAHKLLESGSVNVGQTVKVTLERGATVTMTSVKW
jgi:uncharacterized GH25 family protein